LRTNVSHGRSRRAINIIKKLLNPIFYIAAPHHLIEFHTNSIAPSLEQTGLRVVKYDDIIAQNSMLDALKNTIGAASIMLVDITSSDPDTIFQLGIAEDQRKTIIIVRQKSSKLKQASGKYPLDLRFRRIIEYSIDKPDILISKIHQFIANFYTY